MRIDLHTISHPPSDTPEEDPGRALGVKSSRKKKINDNVNIDL